MNTKVQIPGPSRTRRSHADRTADTRRKVVDAVIESLAELGYQKTSSAEIARRSGVTWGGIQHHFGDKDGIFMAVLEASYNRFAENLAEGPREGAALAERVELFVERSWQHFSSPHYRSAFEILLNLPADLDSSWQDALLESWISLWSRYFPESDLAGSRTGELMHYTVSSMSGLATSSMLGGSRAPSRVHELGFLKNTLVRELS